VEWSLLSGQGKEGEQPVPAPRRNRSSSGKKRTRRLSSDIFASGKNQLEGKKKKETDRPFGIEKNNFINAKRERAGNPTARGKKKGGRRRKESSSIPQVKKSPMGKRKGQPIRGGKSKRKLPALAQSGKKIPHFPRA